MSAQTAIRGAGTVYLQSYETHNTVSLTGALDMREGSVVNGFEQRGYLIDGSDLHYAGIGELGAYSAHAGSLTVGEAPVIGGKPSCAWASCRWPRARA